MADPVKFDKANVEMNCPPDMANCIPMQVYKSGGLIISCWEFSDEEIADLVKTKRVWLWYHSEYFPPTSVMTAYPFTY